MNARPVMAMITVDTSWGIIIGHESVKGQQCKSGDIMTMVIWFYEALFPLPESRHPPTTGGKWDSNKGKLDRTEH